MRAVQVESFGGTEVLVSAELPDPVAGPDQVIVDVAAADVMFLDVRLRGGWGRDFFPIDLPYIPGGAVAGVVSAVGEGVDPGWIGKRVATATAASGIGGGLPIGGYATKAPAKVQTLAEIPEGLDDVHAAALVHDGRTALMLAQHARIQPGEWVLITAAGGGLGILLTQMATAAGAAVIAVTHGETKHALAQRLGAKLVIDSETPGWAGRVREATGGSGVAVVLDGAGGAIGADALSATASGGRVLGYGSAAGSFLDDSTGYAAAHTITVRTLLEMTAADIDWPSLGRRALAEAAAGHLEVVVGQTFPLTEAAAAHAAIESRAAVGRTILTV